jgi:hypothetical protein
MSVKGNENEQFKPLCPFCREPWSDENVRIEEFHASQGCPTCGDVSGGGKIIIRCHKCQKIMYVKEFDINDLPY